MIQRCIVTAVAIVILASAPLFSATAESASAPSTGTTTNPATDRTTSPSTRQTTPSSRGANRPARSFKSHSVAGEWTKAEAAKALSASMASGNIDPARQRLRALSEAIAVQGDDDAIDALANVAVSARMLDQLSTCNESTQKSLLPYLIAHPAVAAALATTLSDDDDVPGAYKVLDSLRAKHGDMLDDFANLTAAICAVRDQPLDVVVAEDPKRVADPIALFEFYTRADKQFFFGVREVPPRLLEFIVDTTTPVQDLAWALNRYRGNRQVGQRFFDIRYDDQAYATGARVKSREAGYSLQTILQLGGVCADQAYYAQSVGKAIGVPATYVRGRSGEVGHAWVGFLERQPRGVRWNFDAGRYEDYRGQKGNVVDPQTRKVIPDAYVSLTAELAGTSAEQRELACALTDAAMRWTRTAASKPTTKSATSDTPTTAANLESIFTEMKAVKIGTRPTPRAKSTSDQLDLLSRAIDTCTGDIRPWLIVADLASNGQLTGEQKQMWTSKVLDLYGDRYPDVTLALLSPMVRSVEDLKEQDRLWNSIFRMFPNRADLCADVRLEQAKLWSKNNDRNKASDYYFDVINRFAASGTQAVDAVKGLEALLRDGSQTQKVLDPYGRAWPKMQRPSTSARQFAKQSNWYIVGEMYVDRLRLSGNDRQADAVLAQLQNAARTNSDDSPRGNRR